MAYFMSRSALALRPNTDVVVSKKDVSGTTSRRSLVLYWKRINKINLFRKIYFNITMVNKVYKSIFLFCLF